MITLMLLTIFAMGSRLAKRLKRKGKQSVQETAESEDSQRDDHQDGRLGGPEEQLGANICPSPS